MGDHNGDLVEKDLLYSTEILSGIVDVVQLCIQWSKNHPGQFHVIHEEDRDEWTIGSQRVVKYVNRILYAKYKDPSVVARVWQAMYYEIPEKLFLNDSTESYAIIFKRTASQQRICIAVFVVMQFIQDGTFTVNYNPNDPECIRPPSLLTLRCVQSDHKNAFLLGYIGHISKIKRPITVEEFCSLPGGSTFLMYNMQPLAEVMLPLSDEDKHEMMHAKQLMPHWQIKHVAVMKLIDVHLQDSHYTRYYTTERGPSVLQEIYAGAMLEASCEYAMTVGTWNPYDMYHFWCRKLL